MSARVTNDQKRPVGTSWGTGGGSARQTLQSPPTDAPAKRTIATDAQSARNITAHGTLRVGHNDNQAACMRPRWGTGTRSAHLVKRGRLRAHIVDDVDSRARPA